MSMRRKRRRMKGSEVGRAPALNIFVNSSMSMLPLLSTSAASNARCTAKRSDPPAEFLSTMPVMSMPPLPLLPRVNDLRRKLLLCFPIALSLRANVRSLVCVSMADHMLAWVLFRCCRPALRGRWGTSWAVEGASPPLSESRLSLRSLSLLLVGLLNIFPCAHPWGVTSEQSNGPEKRNVAGCPVGEGALLGPGELSSGRVGR
mmetsp:Transcript_53112/g.168587  ORF Transcript_53112/g.168587 Transcript_53112/m.168587 type:complete len:203 (-) Transcript_53112:329-937(-)